MDETQGQNLSLLVMRGACLVARASATETVQYGETIFPTIYSAFLDFAFEEKNVLSSV